MVSQNTFCFSPFLFGLGGLFCFAMFDTFLLTLKLWTWNTFEYVVILTPLHVHSAPGPILTIWPWVKTRYPTKNYW